MEMIMVNIGFAYNECGVGYNQSKDIMWTGLPLIFGFGSEGWRGNSAIKDRESCLELLQQVVETKFLGNSIEEIYFPKQKENRDFFDDKSFRAKNDYGGGWFHVFAEDAEKYGNINDYKKSFSTLPKIIYDNLGGKTCQVYYIRGAGKIFYN